MCYGTIYAVMSRKLGNPGVDALFLAVYKATGLKWAKILQRTRKKEIVNSRQIVCYYLHYKMGHTLVETAKMVGYDNHTTVIHAVDTVKDRIKAQDDWTMRILNNLAKQLSY